MPRKLVIGVMGAGDSASPEDCALAEALGEGIARCGWLLLTGGRDAGVMRAAARGAHRAGGWSVGVLPGESEDAGVSADLDLAIFTGMGQARNAINVLSSDVVVACGRGGPGTASEVAHALKAGKPIVLLAAPREAALYFHSLGGRVREVASVEEALGAIAETLSARRP